MIEKPMDVHIDIAELACRMLEAALETKRTLGETAPQFLRRGDRGTLKLLDRQTKAAIAYFEEQLEESGALADSIEHTQQ
jgi:hypothetical protein